MKNKHINTCGTAEILNIIISCFAALFALTVICLVFAGISPEDIQCRIMFTDGENAMLKIFDKTFIVEGNVLKDLIQLPGQSVKLCLNFLPETVSEYAKEYATMLITDIRKLSEFICPILSAIM